LINNRQQGGRRRGRGGQRPQNLGGRPDGNRQDNRQRGNAAQLLEKYKSMARDAQLGGDRVQTEYYLQYADHYYRILGESRARFEEQRRQRGDGDDDAENSSSFNEPGFQHGDDEQMEAGDDQGLADDGGDDDRPQSNDRSGRNDRPERNDRFERDRPEPRESRESRERPDRPERNERNERNERPERSERPERPEPTERVQRRPRNARDEFNGEDVADRTGNDSSRGGNAPRAGGRLQGGNPESIAFDALPPAIGRDASAVEPDTADEAPRPKRRAARKPRPTGGDTDAAPAA
jgi:hypothetical protein